MWSTLLALSIRPTSARIRDDDTTYDVDDMANIICSVPSQRKLIANVRAHTHTHTRECHQPPVGGEEMRRTYLSISAPCCADACGGLQVCVYVTLCHLTMLCFHPFTEERAFLSTHTRTHMAHGGGSSALLLRVALLLMNATRSMT